MNPILQASLGFVAAVGVLIGGLEIAKRKDPKTPEFRYRRMAAMLVGFLSIGVLSFIILSYAFPHQKLESRLIGSALLSWLIPYPYMLFHLKENQKKKDA